MYNIYSRDLSGPIYCRLVKKPWVEKYSLDGATNGRRSRAQNNSFIVPHEEVPGSNPVQDKHLVLFKVILIDYYRHYNV